MVNKAGANISGNTADYLPCSCQQSKSTHSQRSLLSLMSLARLASKCVQAGSFLLLQSEYCTFRSNLQSLKKDLHNHKKNQKLRTQRGHAETAHTIGQTEAELRAAAGEAHKQFAGFDFFTNTLPGLRQTFRPVPKCIFCCGYILSEGPPGLNVVATNVAVQFDIHASCMCHCCALTCVCLDVVTYMVSAVLALVVHHHVAPHKMSCCKR